MEKPTKEQWGRWLAHKSNKERFMEQEENMARQEEEEREERRERQEMIDQEIRGLGENL